MKKNLLLFFLLLGLSAQAQQHHYSWKIGIHGGLSNYHGDINERFWDIPQYFNEPLTDLNFLTYGLSVERHFNRTFALRLVGLKGQVKGRDRRYESNKDYDRALNVQTDIINGSLLGVFYLDNGKIFGEEAIISPYALLGGGLVHFTPRGDLLNENGGRYYYWADNTIRDLSPTDPNSITANIIEPDYVYETDLASLRTEGKDYSQFTWSVVLGLGFKVRLTDRIYIHGEALLHYTGTDYLDDVSGNYPATYDNNFQAYASNPSNRTNQVRGNSPENTDWFGQGLVSLHYSFGQNTHDIRSSMIYTPTVGESNYPLIKEEVTEEKPKTTPTPSTPVRVTKVDTQRVVKVTKITTTIVTETTIDSSSTSDSTTTKMERPVVTPDQSQTTPRERLDYLPNELDSAFYANMLINVEDELIDSLFESQYQRENPAPPWLIYAINKDTTSVPVELVQQQQVATPKVEHLLNDSIDQVRAPASLPNTTDSVEIGTAIAVSSIVGTTQALAPDSLRLLEQYQAQMEVERERFKQELKEQQIRYQYEVKLQQLQNELEQERLRAAAIEQSRKEAIYNAQEAQCQTYLEALSKEEANSIKTNEGNVPVAPSTDPQTKALQEQLALQQAELNALRQANRPNSTTITTPVGTPAPDQERLNTLNNTLASQQQEIEALRQQLKQKEGTSPVVIPSLNTTDDSDRQALDQLMEKETALRLRLETLEKEQPTTTSSAPDTVRVIEEVLNTKALVAQQQIIEDLRQQLQNIQREREAISGTLQEFLNRDNPSYVTKIYFDVARSSLTLQAQENLTSLVAYLQNYPQVNFWVKGYASPTGSKATNDRLSRERASSVYNYLRSQGIAAERLLQTAHGERNSGVRNELDRRAEIHLSFSK